MEDWTQEVEEKLRKKNRILFSHGSLILRELSELIRVQKLRALVVWAFACAEAPLRTLTERYPDEERPGRAATLCKSWAAGEMKMPLAKRAILDAHAFAKEIESEEDAALCHAVGQACAAVHVETHALGLPMYELTAIVRRCGGKNYRFAVEQKVAESIRCLKSTKKRPGRAAANGRLFSSAKN